MSGSTSLVRRKCGIIDPLTEAIRLSRVQSVARTGTINRRSAKRWFHRSSMQLKNMLKHQKSARHHQAIFSLASRSTWVDIALHRYTKIDYAVDQV
jgi:hypothetical protein